MITAPRTFRALGVYNFRLWSAGALISNIGTWMQRTAQDWIVLAELTDHSATSVGIVMALQFGPQALLLPFTGWAADNLDRRKLLLATQAGLGILALILGLLVVSGHVVLWHVYVIAFLLGCVAAFDAPARQTFVSDLVDDARLANAVALNSTSFAMGRMIGPAVAGLLIASVGTGWVFILNAASFVAVIISLLMLRRDQLTPTDISLRLRGGLLDGFRYVWARPDLRAILIMLFLIGTFGLNFPIYIATMSITVFGHGASEYGLLTSMMAVGTVLGALLAARRDRPRFGLLMSGSVLFGCGLTIAAIAPGFWIFGATLFVVGVAALTFMTASNSLVQLSTERSMRGRVMAIRIAIAMGGTPIGAPIVGWTADAFGARWGVAIGAAAGFVAALVGLNYLIRERGLRAERVGGRWRLVMTRPDPAERAGF
jgi:MFS family permease